MSATLLAHPEWRAGLLTLFLLALGALGAARLVAGRRARRLLGPRGARLGHLRGADAALLLATAAVGIALLGPRIGERVVWARASGVDVVVLVDVSPSMLAVDVPPSRLTRAREAARRVLAALPPGDRAALAAFSARGVLLTPLTPDRQALRRMLPSLTPDLIQEQGSRIGEGVRAALGAFDAASARPRVLFLVSDGEDPERGDVGLAEVVGSGVRVVAALFGSEEGATIPAAGGPLHDAGGRLVVSRRQVGPVAELASASGGQVLLADRWGEIDLARMQETLGRDRASAPGEPVARHLPATRVSLFAAAAFALLALELARSGRGRRISRPSLAMALGAALVAVAPGPGRPSELEARVRDHPHDPRGLISLGLARAEAGDAEEASRAFFAAAADARDPELAALAYYDLAVAELSLGRLSAASSAFYDALALRPDDLQAKFNLEWTLRALRDAAASEAAEPAEPPPTPAGQPAEETGARDEGEERPRAEQRETEGEGELAVPDLDPAAVERWLAQVPDEPTGALRDAARSGREARPTRRAPGW